MLYTKANKCDDDDDDDDECFNGKYTTRKIPHAGVGWNNFHILTSQDIDYFTDIMFDP